LGRTVGCADQSGRDDGFYGCPYSARGSKSLKTGTGRKTDCRTGEETRSRVIGTAGGGIDGTTGEVGGEPDGESGRNEGGPRVPSSVGQRSARSGRRRIAAHRRERRAGVRPGRYCVGRKVQRSETRGGAGACHRSHPGLAASCGEHHPVDRRLGHARVVPRRIG